MKPQAPEPASPAVGETAADDFQLARAVKLLTIATEITALAEPEDVPRHVVRCLAEELGFKTVSILLFNPATQALHYAAEVGLPPEVKAMGHRPGGTTATVFETGNPVFVEDMASDPRVNPGARAFFRSYACLPIAYRERRIGLLIVNYGDTHVFDAMERQILRAFASQTAVALENVNLLGALKRHSENLAALARLGQTFSERLELAHALNVLERSLKEQLPQVDAAFCWLLEGRSCLVPGFRFGLEALGASLEAAEEGEPFLVDLLALREPQRLPLGRLLAAPPGAADCLAFVLRTASGIEGLLALHAPAGPDAFSALDLDFVRALGDRAALAIHHARIFQASQDAACLDSMTGVYNHGTFTSRAAELLQEARRSSHPLSLLMLDADHFKRFNDTHGHLFGDSVLMALAREVKAQVRPTDLVGRWGGEEFAVALPGVTAPMARVIAERIRLAMEHLVLPAPSGLPVQAPTVSVGLASLDPGIETLAQLVHAADLALYRAKSEGRNQTCG